MHYFAKWGKVYGPFDENELAAMQARGELKEFSWKWNATSEEWVAMDSPPPPLRVKKEPRRERPVEDRTLRLVKDTGFSDTDKSHLGQSVICHNNQVFMDGSLDFVTETGGELLSGENEGAYPVFGEASHVQLNVLNEETGHMHNLVAEVCYVKREGQSWRYQLKWIEPRA